MEDGCAPEHARALRCNTADHFKFASYRPELCNNVEK